MAVTSSRAVIPQGGRVKVSLAFQVDADGAIQRRKKVLTFRAEETLRHIYDTIAGRAGGPPLWPKGFADSLDAGSIPTLLFQEVDAAGGPCDDSWIVVPNTTAVLGDLVRGGGENFVVALLLRSEREADVVFEHPRDNDADTATDVERLHRCPSDSGLPKSARMPLRVQGTFLHFEEEVEDQVGPPSPRANSDPGSHCGSMTASGAASVTSLQGLLEEAERARLRRLQYQEYIETNLMPRLDGGGPNVGANYDAMSNDGATGQHSFPELRVPPSVPHRAPQVQQNHMGGGSLAQHLPANDGEYCGRSVPLQHQHVSSNQVPDGRSNVAGLTPIKLDLLAPVSRPQQRRLTPPQGTNDDLARNVSDSLPPPGVWHNGMPPVHAPLATNNTGQRAGSPMHVPLPDYVGENSILARGGQRSASPMNVPLRTEGVSHASGSESRPIGEELTAEARIEELFDAVTRNDLSAVQQLIRTPSDVNECTERGSRVLFRAVIKAKEPDIVGFLLDARADARSTDDKGNSVMHFWARATVGRNHLVDIGACLVRAGANVNAKRNPDGMSALHHVVIGHNNRRGWLDFHKALFLVRNGADTESCTETGQTPRDLISGDCRAATKKLEQLLAPSGFAPGSWPRCDHAECCWCFF